MVAYLQRGVVRQTLIQLLQVQCMLRQEQVSETLNDITYVPVAQPILRGPVEGSRRRNFGGVFAVGGYGDAVGCSGAFQFFVFLHGLSLSSSLSAVAVLPTTTIALVVIITKIFISHISTTLCHSNASLSYMTTTFCCSSTSAGAEGSKG